MTSATRSSSGQIGGLIRREVRGSFRQQVHEVVAKLADTLLRLRAHGVERVEVAELGRRLHLREHVPVLETVDLVDGDHDRASQLGDAARDEAVSRADVRSGVDDEQDRVHVLERAVHGLLHALRERVHRTLEAGQVDEDELVADAGRRAEDAASGRIGDSGGDRDLLSAEGIDERRLADVRAPGHRDEAGLHAGLPSGHPDPPPAAIVTWQHARRGYDSAPRERRSIHGPNGVMRGSTSRTTPAGARPASSSPHGHHCGTRHARPPSRAATAGSRRTGRR